MRGKDGFGEEMDGCPVVSERPEIKQGGPEYAQETAPLPPHHAFDATVPQQAPAALSGLVPWTFCYLLPGAAGP